MAASLSLLVRLWCRSKDKKGEAGDLKVKLEKLKKEKNGLDAQIRQLEEQLAKAIPHQQQAQKLVILLIRCGSRILLILLNCRERSMQIMCLCSSSGHGGVVKAVYVKSVAG